MIHFFKRFMYLNFTVTPSPSVLNVRDCRSLSSNIKDSDCYVVL
uniref:Uncharacterized protein n=1 Tax=Arundo donax TaxID=35708 RepID=A0A0A9G0M5_ARUDO